MKVTLAMVCSLEQMGQDADRRMDQRKDELLREELKAWENEGKMSIAKNRVALHQPNLSLTKGAADMLFSFKSLSLGGPLAKADHPRRNRGGLRRVY